MVRRTASFIALAVALTACPAFADDTLILADASSSKSRAEARHDTSGTEVVKSANARSKSRRATRGSAASDETVVATTNRGKRSRRNPGQEDLSAPMLADADTNAPGLVALAANTTLLATHVQSIDFTGESGAVALYHLVGKAVADMPLNPAEAHAIKVVMKDVTLSQVIEDTEARLLEAAADGETLDKIADALGVPRPVFTPGGNPNLGASLAVEATVSEG